MTIWESVMLMRVVTHQRPNFEPENPSNTYQGLFFSKWAFWGDLGAESQYYLHLLVYLTPLESKLYSI